MTHRHSFLTLLAIVALLASSPEAQAFAVSPLGVQLISADAQARGVRVKPRLPKAKPKGRPKTSKPAAKPKGKPKAGPAKGKRSVPSTWFTVSTKKVSAKRVRDRRVRVGGMGRRSGGKTAKNRGGQALYGASTKHGARVEKIPVRKGKVGRPVTKRPGRPRTQWQMTTYKLKPKAQRRTVDTTSWKNSQFYSYGGVPKGSRRGLVKNGVPGPKLCKKLKAKAERGYKPGQAYKPGRKAVGAPRAVAVNGKGAGKSGRRRTNLIMPANMFRNQKGKVNPYITQPKRTSLR